jgi:hypothetical protein
MKKVFVVLGLFVLSSSAFSQEDFVSQQQGKLFGIIEGGLLVGNSDNVDNAPFIFHSSLNYAILRNLSAGVGVGVEFYQDTHLPVSANLMYQLGKSGSVIPFAKFEAGYQIPLDTKMERSYYYYYDYYSPDTRKMDAKGGLLLNPSIGIIIQCKNDIGIVLSAGYRHQQLEYVAKEDKDFSQLVEYNRLSLKLGLIF